MGQPQGLFTFSSRSTSVSSVTTTIGLNSTLVLNMGPNFANLHRDPMSCSKLHVSAEEGVWAHGLGIVSNLL